MSNASAPIQVMQSKTLTTNIFPFEKRTNKNIHSVHKGHSQAITCKAKSFIELEVNGNIKANYLCGNFLRIGLTFIRNFHCVRTVPCASIGLVDVITV